jgi:hypothetical protein
MSPPFCPLMNNNARAYFQLRVERARPWPRHRNAQPHANVRRQGLTRLRTAKLAAEGIDRLWAVLGDLSKFPYLYKSNFIDTCLP